MIAQILAFLSVMTALCVVGIIVGSVMLVMFGEDAASATGVTKEGE